MNFEDRVRDFLKVIDFDLCVVDEDSLNYILEFPIDFKSIDDLRVFRCDRSDKGDIIKIMNTKYPKHPFIKNGIAMFELSWRKGGLSSKKNDIFSAEIFHHDSLYISFIGRSSRKNHVSYRKFKHEEYIDVLYSVDTEKRKFEIIFNVDKKSERRISIQVPIENRNRVALLRVGEDKQEVYRQELEAKEMEDYIHSLFFRARNIIMETHDGIKTLDSTIFDKVFDYYGVAKEFMNIMYNSKGSNEVINALFKQYFDSDEFEIADICLETMNKVASRVTPIESMRFMAEHEKFIQEQMQKIENQEYQEEVEMMMGDENYDNGENWNMVLGKYRYKRPSKMIRENFGKEESKDNIAANGPIKVLKRAEE